MIVVDASVAVKWFLSEAHSDTASELLAVHAGKSYAPDLLLVEVTSALVRNANMIKSTRPNIEAALIRFNDLLQSGDVIAQRISPQMIRQSATLALDIGHPLKDCIYLALAMELDCDLWTADARFAAKARGVYAAVRVLGE